MRSGTFRFESPADECGYTHMFASITEEDCGGFTLQVRLFQKAKRGNAAWGEEIADCFETASQLIAALAAEFSIESGNIEIEIRMQEAAGGTRH
jgi:hypothetical protein